MPGDGLADTREGELDADTVAARVVGAVRRAQGDIDPLGLAIARERAKAMVFSAPAEAVTVGRYVVSDRIGHGGMGVVYAAYDPDLDRRIALKLLHPNAHGATAQQDDRLLREAQALAKLTHPNVVAIFDVGRVHEPDLASPPEVRRGSSIFLAMEYVEGVTLSRWIARENPSIRQIVEVMTQAARGLAAAHEHGLVHRDFKPENVMVDHDGRVRVMDFGIARQLEQSASSPDAPSLASASDRLATPTTGLVGTPAYMAPEQMRGEVAGAAADQFAFCVTFWEAVYKERPFDGDTLVALTLAVLEGRRRPPPRHSAVPRWLRRILDRGLATDPERRWPSMTGLVEALGRARSRARWHGAAAVVLGVVTAGAAAQAYRMVARRQQVAACATEASTIDEVWNEEARADVRAGLLATGVSYATTTADNVIGRLDERADAWEAHRNEACMNAMVDHVWDDDTRENVLWCLDERRLELASVVSMFVTADAGVVATAVNTAAKLPDSERCVAADEVALLPRAPTAAERSSALELRAEIARATALRAAGRYPDGLAVLRDARARADALDSSRWPAVVLAQEASLLSASGAYPESEVAGVSAYMAAASGEAWDVAADAANTLVYTLGHGQRRHAEAREWARHAESAATLAGDPLGLWAARRARVLAVSEADAGEYATAKELHERSIETLERVLGPDHPDVANGVANLAIVLAEMGDYPRAIEMNERALGLFEQTFGDDHPLVHNARSNLAMCLHPAGRSVEALALYAVVLAARERTDGPDHPNTADTLNNIGAIQADLGNYAAAKTMYERALAIRERAFGRDHLAVGMTVANLANAHFHLGDDAQAELLHERAVTIKETSLPPDHPDLANSLSGLAITQLMLGKHDEARASATRALAIHEKSVGPDHPWVAIDLANLAGIELERRETETAVALFERAMAIFDAMEGVQPNEPLATFGLARALVAADRDHPRAVALAERALETYRSEGEGHRDEIAKIERWLAEHGDEHPDGAP